MAEPHSSRACDALAEQRSALVDGALDDTARERVLAHLAGCPACRAEVAELRRLRRLLNDDAAPHAAPHSDELSHRLVAIAGDDAREPLLSAPFRRRGAVALRRRHRRTARIVAAVGMGVVALGLVAAAGLSAAPPLAPAVADPVAGAQAEFSAVVAQLPLADSAGSVAMSNGQRLSPAISTVGPSVVGPAGIPQTRRELDATAALTVLTRAAAAAGEVRYRGTQSVRIYADGRMLGTEYTVETRSGDGRQVAVLDATTRQVLSTVHSDTTARVADSDQLELLRTNFLLGGSTGALVAGQAATVISAVRSNGQTAARWWVDDEFGLLLWQETYDDSGLTTMSAGFTTVTFGEPDVTAQRATRSTESLTTTSLTLASSADLEARGWSCPNALAGLSLIRVRADSAESPTVVHLGFSDGLTSVSVFEQRGTLSRAPSGTHWDDTTRAYVRDGAAKVATWQSGSTVFTVVTDGSAEMLAGAVAALPHDQTPPRTTIERVRAGWSRILDSVTG